MSLVDDYLLHNRDDGISRRILGREPFFALSLVRLKPFKFLGVYAQLALKAAILLCSSVRSRMQRYNLTYLFDSL
jgi:hypothetical protein